MCLYGRGSQRTNTFETEQKSWSRFVLDPSTPTHICTHTRVHGHGPPAGYLHIHAGRAVSKRRRWRRKPPPPPPTAPAPRRPLRPRPRSPTPAPDRHPRLGCRGGDPAGGGRGSRAAQPVPPQGGWFWGERSSGSQRGEVSRHRATCEEPSGTDKRRRSLRGMWGLRGAQSGGGRGDARRRRRAGGGGRAQPPSPPGTGAGEEAGAPPLSHASPVQRLQGGEGEAAGGRKGGKCCNVAPGGQTKEAANPPPEPGASPRAEPAASSGRAADSPAVPARGGEGGTDATPARGTAARSGRKGAGGAAPTFHHPVRRR